MARGLVISDLHLFSIRSIGERHLHDLRDTLSKVDVIVLNGDTFDFRWSHHPDEESSINAALEWLRNFVAAYPQADVHFVVGNHDCLAAFTSRLDELDANLPSFHWHETILRLGGNLFVHGDCAHGPMDADGLDRYRSIWKHDRQRHSLLARVYIISDRLGLTWLVHRGHFTRRKTLTRLTWYLDRAFPEWGKDTRDCYFGHTHFPLQNVEWEGVRFHNTGSAIAGSPFAPAEFLVTSTTPIETQVPGDAPDRPLGPP